MRAKVLFMTALLLVCFTMVASAQVTWNTTYNNYQVVFGGRTELMGSVTWTSAIPGQTTSTPASAVQIDYQLPIGNLDVGEAPITNTLVGNVRTMVWLHGITLTVKGTALSAVADGFNVNSLGDNAMLISLPAGVAVDIYDQIRLDGVRCDVSALDLHQTVQAIISSVPSDANNYNPNVVTVATIYDNFTVKNNTPGVVSVCQNGQSGEWGFQITEGFSGAFADYTGPNKRFKEYGATDSTTFILTVSDLPAGVEIDWPATIDTTGATGAFLEWVDTSSDGLSATYVFVAGATSDSVVETFEFVASFTVDITKVTVGVAKWTITMGPVYDPDVIYMDQIISFSIPAKEPQNAVSTVKCVTNLLYPYVVKGFGGYDTGIAVANTSFDKSAVAVDQGANPQHGTVTFFMYPKFAAGVTVAAAPMSFTTAEVMAGDSYANVLSALLPAAATEFQGYVIAVCNFQFGHGYAYIAFNMGQASGIAQGYVANVLPDFTSFDWKSRQAQIDDVTTNLIHAESLGQ